MNSTRVLLLAFVVVLYSSARTNATAPSNLRLIAVMPPGTESVIVFRQSMISGKDSIVRDELGSLPFPWGSELDSVVRNAVSKASPIAYAWGGSDFRMPPTSGMTGNYNERTIYVVSESLEPLRRRVEADDKVRGITRKFDVDGTFVVEARVTDDSDRKYIHPMGESWYAAFPDPHTLITAESEADIRHMLNAWKAREEQMPPQWQPVAKDFDLDAPILVLRSYPSLSDPSIGRCSPFLPPAENRVSHLAAALSDVRRADIHVIVLSENAAAALAWYQEQVLFLHSAEFDWELITDAKGFQARVVARTPGWMPDMFTLMWILLFGPNVMI